MRKIHALLLCALLILSACTPVFDNKQKVVKETKDESSNQTAIIPSYSAPENDYKMILSKDSPTTSAARGLTTNQMGNRLDIAEFEDGLRRHSKEYFDPDKYYFQPGQYLDYDTLIEWLSRESEDNPEGLNPKLNEDKAKEKDFRKNPKYISNIVEQDYLVKKDDNVVNVKGVTIGISMRSVYNFSVDGKEYTEKHSKSELLSKGKAYANEILKRLREREELQDVPIMFAIYQEETAQAKVPGSFLAKSYVKGSDMTAGNWKAIKEENVLFPSDQAEKDHFEDAQLFSEFRAEVSDYFPNFVGMIANGFYVDNELKKVKINIPIQFNSQSEVVGFTQYVHSLVMEMFEDHYDIEVNIYSMDHQESVIVKKAGEEDAYVHVYQ
ncbi:CamS family sex pheromone protein [Halobacillus salinarum]|uniref:CamS family sex pheromone protein n=1 Tax=Halobacillus salinarum TaxID=2932257 RepID=A0ABY4EHY7_9BACI|nr:CamS family sex pheromone protein [Halobacillus salinarum]UOQ44080.1 CamS family sex pheromone protein [Halobacillus salinarum]